MQPTFWGSGCVGGWSGWTLPATPRATRPLPALSLRPALLTKQVLLILFLSPHCPLVCQCPPHSGSSGKAWLWSLHLARPRGQWEGVCRQRQESPGESGGVRPVLPLLLSCHREPAQGTVHTLTPCTLGGQCGWCPRGQVRLLPNTFFFQRLKDPFQSCWWHL